jgi:hypothetical protein
MPAMGRAFRVREVGAEDEPGPPIATAQLAAEAA